MKIFQGRLDEHQRAKFPTYSTHVVLNLCTLVLFIIFNSLINSYMRQFTRPSLVQIMACRLDGAKPLFEPMLEYY